MVYCSVYVAARRQDVSFDGSLGVEMPLELAGVMDRMGRSRAA